ncbi:hypothetical protein BDN67DRAFT_971584 [Paxillus ammoniavirescens]|nr:hypothetical protein BDN67DRAFT_971584 [Paxillus ammoniavirescens]
MKYVEFGGLNDEALDANGDDWSSHESDAGVHLPVLNADKANAPRLGQRKSGWSGQWSSCHLFLYLLDISHDTPVIL